MPRTVGPNVSHLALGTAANGAVTPRKTGVHAKRARPAEPRACCLPVWEVSEEFQLDGAWPWSRLFYPKPNVQWFLTTLMKQNCSLPTASFLEHPRDPLERSSSPSASRCSSLWATKVFKAWYPTVGHTLVKFDQCRLGQLVEKATSISSDLDIQCWDGLRCNHAPHKLPEDMQSSDLSRTADWTHQNPSARDSLPFRQRVKHMDHGVDRPTSLPLAHRISLMDEHVVVQLGFRTRPLRDGGGKSGWSHH